MEDVMDDKRVPTDKELLAVLRNGCSLCHRSPASSSGLSEEELTARLDRACDKVMVRAVYDFAWKRFQELAQDGVSAEEWSKLERLLLEPPVAPEWLRKAVLEP